MKAYGSNRFDFWYEIWDESKKRGISIGKWTKRSQRGRERQRAKEEFRRYESLLKTVSIEDD